MYNALFMLSNHDIFHNYLLDNFFQKKKIILSFLKSHEVLSISYISIASISLESKFIPRDSSPGVSAGPYANARFV